MLLGLDGLIGRYIYDLQLLLKGVRVRNGMALLEPSNIELKGWQNEDMQANRDQEFVRNLRRRMGFVIYTPSRTFCLTFVYASLENRILTPVKSIRNKQQNPRYGRSPLPQQHYNHIPLPVALQPKPHSPNAPRLPYQNQGMKLMN